MANKKAVLGRPLPDASVPRNAFDRSSRRQYHLALGQATPVWWEPCIAGTHLKLNRKIFQRTADVNTAAFPTMDTHIQYYFVPFRQLMSQWDDFKLNIQDSNSSALASPNAVSGDFMDVMNRVPYFNMADLGSALTSVYNNNVLDIVGQPVYDFACKVLNLLGYGKCDYNLPPTGIDVNALPLLAYHKIYYDHFRNTAYEGNSPRMYNMDYLWSKNGSMALGLNELLNLIKPHYVNYRNDYFTNIYPSLNYVQSTPTGASWQLPSNIMGLSQSSSVPLNGATGSDADRWTKASGQPLTNSLPMGNIMALGTGHANLTYHGQSDNDTYHTHAINGSATINLQNALTAQTMRSIFAMDKLLRSSAYAPKHAKEQYEARFGIKFRQSPNESIYVGSFMNDIKIGEVTATANSVNASGTIQPTGAIGGKGIGFGDWGDSLEFDCQEDGIIMAIQYEMLRSSYRSYGIDSYLTKHIREDFFMPEFEDMGLEPVLGSEFNFTLGQSIVMGYRPRYQRYKLGIDKSYGLFADTTSDMSMFINHTDVGRIPSGSGLSTGWFKVQPTDLDGIMRVDYDGHWDTDQFICDCEFGCVAIQNMSVHGQPSL